MIAILIVLGVLAAIVFAFVGIYNRLVGLKTRSEGSWSDIDVQLKRRHNLVGNIVETVKGYAKHEESTLEKGLGLVQRQVYADQLHHLAKGDLGQAQLLSRPIRGVC